MRVILAAGVSKSRRQTLREFVKTLKQHWEQVFAFISTPITHAGGEGTNRIIRVVKNGAGGSRT